MDGIKDVNVNSSESMGQLGNRIVDTGTKVFDQGESIAVITVVSGTATVTGKQCVSNPNGKNWYPDWTAVELSTGTYIVNLREVTVVASELTIVYYGA